MKEYGRPPARRTSDWLGDGVLPGDLRRRSWEHPHQGVARPAGEPPDPTLSRITDATALLPDGCVVGGWASAVLQAVPYIDGRDRWGRDHPVLMFMTEGHRLRTRAGIRPSRRALLPGETTAVGGLAVTSLARTAFDLMCDAPTLSEAVVASDMIASTVTGERDGSLDQIRRLVAAHHKTKGIRLARLALEYAFDRSCSPWESRVRMVAARQAGLVHLLVNVPVFDLGGNLLGIPDLLDPESGLVIESDGAGHRETERHSHDNHREEAFEDAGLTVVRVTAWDLRDELQVAQRLRRADRRARQHDRSRDRWTLAIAPWWQSHWLSRRWNWPPTR